MSTDKDSQLTDIFFAACDLNSDDRAVYLDEVCAGNQALREQVERLIEIGGQIDPGIETHIVGKVLKGAAADFVRRQETAPTRIGPYSILREIGEGGMSVVYEAEQHEPVKRKVALKVIRPGMDTREVINRFESERQALAVMDHVNIARIYDGGATDAGRPYFVMELVSGEPITEYCDHNRLTIAERLKVFIHVCLAVQHAHQKGVVHRDLKPSNIIVSEQDGEPLVKVIDFGIAKALDVSLNDDPTETRYGQVMGTPTHMSPEQATGDIHDIDTRTDVYSLGVVLFQLLAGELPYDVDLRAADSIRQTIGKSASIRPSAKLRVNAENARQIAYDRRSGFQRLLKLLTGDLDWVVVKAMEIERERRYQTVNAFAKDIQNILDNRPVEARPPGTAYVLSRFIRRNKKTVVAASVTVLALVSGITMATIGLVRATQAEQEARRDQRSAEMSRDFLVSTFELADPAASLGERISAKELLNRGVSRIEVELDGEPRIQGELLQTMGRAFENLALYREAEPMLRRALQLDINVYGADHPTVGEAYQELGEILRRVGQYDESKEAHQQAINIFRQVYGDTHPSVAINTSKLGLTYLNDGDYNKAEELFDASQTIYELLELETSNDFADNLNNLGGVKLRQGDTAKARDYFQSALVIWQKNHGEIHPDIALVMANLGTAYAKESEFDLAEHHYQSALEMRRRLYDDSDHSEIAVSLNNLAMLYKRKGDLHTAEPLFRESLAIRRKVFGNMSPAVATGLNNLAGVLRDNGELLKAEETYRDSLVVRSVLQGDNHPSVAITRTNLAETLVEQGRNDEALREVGAALIILKTTLGPVHWRVAAANSVKGAAMAGEGDYLEAEEIMVKAYQDIRDARGDSDIYTRRALERVIGLYADWGRTESLEQYQTLHNELFAGN